MSQTSRNHVLNIALASHERPPDTPPLSATAAAANDCLRYCTIDSVNLELAWDLAEPFGLTIEHREPHDGPVPGPAMLVDADYWWFSDVERKQGLERLVAQEGRGIIGVHSRHLDDEQLAWLNANGIHASNRLDRDLIALIATDLARCPIRSYQPVHVT